MQLTFADVQFIGLCLEGFLYGLYSGIFIMYLQHEASKESTDRKKNFLFFLMCALYVSSFALVVFDTTSLITTHTSSDQISDSTLRIIYVQNTLSGCCDFIAQSILVYRCWIVWGRDIRVVIIPSVFAIAYLALWLASNSASYIDPDSPSILVPKWGYVGIITSLAMSLTVNALVTGLIVLRIFQVFCQVKPTLEENKTLGTTGGRKLWTLILILIESGMALFSIQLARVVLYVTQTTAALIADQIIIGIYQMLNGITPTIILVRVSMGFSFHNQESLVETVGSLRFASDNPNPNPETESIGSMTHPEARDDDVGDEQSNDMDVVEELI